MKKMTVECAGCGGETPVILTGADEVAAYGERHPEKALVPIPEDRVAEFGNYRTAKRVWGGVYPILCDACAERTE